MKQGGPSSDIAGEEVGQIPTQASDEQLLEQIAGGEEQALAELYQRYGKPLYNYLLRLVHEPTVAEDLLQEVFVAINFHDLDPISSVQTDSVVLAAAVTKTLANCNISAEKCFITKSIA